jgi:hypothetical protein
MNKSGREVVPHFNKKKSFSFFNSEDSDSSLSLSEDDNKFKITD